jgi:hypothetical protein
MSWSRTKLIVSIFVLVSAAGCASAPHQVVQERAETTPSESEQVTTTAAVDDAEERFVLVEPDAFFYTAPDTTAQKVNPFWSLDAATNSRHRGHFYVARLLDKGGLDQDELDQDEQWVTVETLASRSYENHCHGSLSYLTPFRLQLFVRKDDLVSLTVKPIRQNYSDGTSVRLTRGVGLVSLESEHGNLYRIAVDGLRFAVYLKPDDVGYVYTAPETFEPRKFEEGRPLLVTDAFLEGRVIFGRTGAVKSSSRSISTVVVEDVEPQSDEVALASFARDCVAFRASVSSSDISDGKSAWGILSGSSSDGEFDDVHVRKGASVYWPDGTRGGTAVAESEFYDEVETSDGRRCFQKVLRYIRDDEKESPADHNFITMCFEPQDIVEPDDGADDGARHHPQ